MRGQFLKILDVPVDDIVFIMFTIHQRLQLPKVETDFIFFVHLKTKGEGNYSDICKSLIMYASSLYSTYVPLNLNRY